MDTILIGAIQPIFHIRYRQRLVDIRDLPGKSHPASCERVKGLALRGKSNVRYRSGISRLSHSSKFVDQIFKTAACALKSRW